MLGLGSGFFQANSMGQEIPKDWAVQVVQHLSVPAELPTQAAAKMFLQGFFPEFSESKECKAMLERIYQKPGIDNGGVGNAAATAAITYAEKISQPLLEGEEFPGQNLYEILESFFAWQPGNQEITLPEKDTFLEKLRVVEDHFCQRFGQSLEEHLYVQGMTKTRAKMLVDAAIFMQMRQLVSANKSMAAAYKLMRYPEQIKAFILGEA